MRASSDLFDLIHALSPSEKRYFRIFASRHVQQGQNNYMRIFELIEAQEKHDEAAILEQLQEEKLKAQFAVQKNYLHKLILKSLRNFYAEASVDFQLKEYLMNVELLLRKGLVRQSQKQLARAEKLALENEKYELMFEITGYKILLLMKNEDADLERLEKHLHEIFVETGQNFERLFNIQSYRRISMQLLMMNRRDPQAQTDESRRAYAALMAEPLMLSQDKALTKRAALYFLQSQFVYHFSCSDFANAYSDGEKIVQLMEQNPHLVAERPENYVIALQNQIMVATFYQPLEVSRALIAQLRDFASRFPEIRFDEATARKVPVFAANLELHLLLNHKRYDEAAVFLPEILAQVEAGYSYNVNEGYVLVDLYFMAARLHLYRREYRQALGFVNKLLNLEGLNAEYESFLSARILNMVILFEAGETQMLEYALASLHRFLQQKRKLFPFEKVLIDFIRKASGELPGTQMERHFRQLRDDLRNIVNTPGEVLTITQFDILGWLDARVDG